MKTVLEAMTIFIITLEYESKEKWSNQLTRVKKT